MRAQSCLFPLLGDAEIEASVTANQPINRACIVRWLERCSLDDSQTECSFHAARTWILRSDTARTSV